MVFAKKSKEMVEQVKVKQSTRFNTTARGAVNKVGLALSYNKKTVYKWQQDFYSNQGNFTESKQGKHVSLFIIHR